MPEERFERSKLCGLPRRKGRCVNVCVRGPHVGVSVSNNRILIEKSFNLGEILFAEQYLERPHILIKVLDLGGARDGNNIISLVLDPCERKLTCGAALPRCNLMQSQEQLLVLVQVFAR
jgi:hypothetical protein